MVPAKNRFRGSVCQTLSLINHCSYVINKSLRMNQKISREINEQIEYGLESIDSDRTVELSLRDFLYTYKAIMEFRRFFHQPAHYPTLIELLAFLGNEKSGAYSVINELAVKTLDKYIPEDIEEDIENNGRFTHPEYPFYYHLKSDPKFQLSAAGNTEPPAFQLIKSMGFDISKTDDTWTAVNHNSRFNASSPLELLGIISLYRAKGKNWKVSDEQIDEFLKFDEQ